MLEHFGGCVLELAMPRDLSIKDPLNGETQPAVTREQRAYFQRHQGDLQTWIECET